jgi:hypothetical protein
MRGFFSTEDLIHSMASKAFWFAQRRNKKKALNHQVNKLGVE